MIVLIPNFGAEGRVPFRFNANTIFCLVTGHDLFLDSVTSFRLGVRFNSNDLTNEINTILRYTHEEQRFGVRLNNVKCETTKLSEYNVKRKY